VNVARLSSAGVDYSAVFLSTLCLVHCLALPALAIFFPVAAAFAEVEAIHRAFVVGAIVTSGLAIYQIREQSYVNVLAPLLVIGTLVLAMAAFWEAMHDYETALTIVGALMLSGSHIARRLLENTARKHAQRAS